MKVETLKPAVEGRVAFDLYYLLRMRDCAGCYCLTNAAGDVLYVGQALSIQRRLVQHFDSSKRLAQTAYGRVSLVWWREDTAIRLDALERGWLEAIRLADGELPVLNSLSGPL